jgi:hypothetical protein|nr:MAG TPA: hypothetical protein [Caudoviricetes sp.]
MVRGYEIIQAILMAIIFGHALTIGNKMIMLIAAASFIIYAVRFNYYAMQPAKKGRG